MQHYQIVLSSVLLYFFSFHLQFWWCWGWLVHDSHFHRSIFFVLLQCNQILLFWIISLFLLHIWIFCRGASISKPSSIPNATEKVNAPTSSENTFFLINPLAPHCFGGLQLPLMEVGFFSSERAENPNFPASPAECMLLPGPSRNEENAPIASLSTGVIPIVQNSLPTPVQVRHGFSSPCNAFKP